LWKQVCCTIYILTELALYANEKCHHIMETTTIVLGADYLSSLSNNLLRCVTYFYILSSFHGIVSKQHQSIRIWKYRGFKQRNLSQIEKSGHFFVTSFFWTSWFSSTLTWICIMGIPSRSSVWTFLLPCRERCSIKEHRVVYGTVNMDWVWRNTIRPGLSSLNVIYPMVSVFTVLIIWFSSIEGFFSFTNFWKVQNLFMASKRLVFTIVYKAGIVVLVLFRTKVTFLYPFWLKSRQAAKTFLKPLVIQDTSERYSSTFLERIVCGISFKVFGHVFFFSGVLLNLIFRTDQNSACAKWPLKRLDFSTT